MKKIKYICYYSYCDGLEQRQGVQSASTKIDYIISVLNRIGYSVDIISKTGLSHNGFRPSFGGKKELDNNNTVRHFLSLGCRDILPVYLCSRFLNTFHFFFWLLFNVHYKEQIIVYHSTGYIFSLFLLKMVKRPIVIGEIEEIYKDVRHSSIIVNSQEKRFVNCCDKFIFPTTLLNSKINVSRKPHLIMHGIYSVEKKRQDKFNDGFTHIVYGGTLNPAKGCIAAAETIKYLPNRYFIHICGFGPKEQIEKIKGTVGNLNNEGYPNVKFEGNLKGDSYKSFIQKCNIGLCTQDPQAAFTNTSFPSKVLMYLSNGLHVVSINIPAIKESAVASVICFYDKQTPQMIAEAIEKVNLKEDRGTEEILERLDKEMLAAFNELLN